MFEKTKALCDSFLGMGVPGFDLIVYKDGQQILRHMGGYSDKEKKLPMKGTEKVNIYSCSKPITVTAAMQLWEKGLFALEDKLSDYMPEFAHMTVRTEGGIVPAQNPIRIHHLFEMTAGFSYDVRSPRLVKLREETGGVCPTREVARALAAEPLHFEPGTQYRYSLCHDVLAALVEVLSGQPFDDYVRTHIFAPLGMHDSTFLLPPERYEEVAAHYVFKADEGKAVERSKFPSYRIGTEHASGGAGCVSTLADYIKFAEALRTGETLLKRSTIRLMTTDRLTEEQRTTFTMKLYGYGLGMRAPLEGCSRRDYGWGGAAGAYLAVDEEHGISLFYVQHMLSSPNQSLRGSIYTCVLEDLGIAATHTVTNNNLTY